MRPHHQTTRPISEPSSAPDVGELLARAAVECVHQGLGVEAFMARAWAAYVEARPGMREQLEDLQLRAQLEELRALDKIGKA
jgi:hypothetical protein